MLQQQYDNYALFRAIRDQPDLTTAEKCLAYTIATYRNGSTGECFPSQQRLAWQTGLGRQRVNALVKSLKTKRILQVQNSKTDASKKKVCNYLFLIG